ncbi:TIM-barrel domain-containing protein [Nocardioides sp. CER19]|uniref:TIM-barrel domain-containing protein n=1 Tax=Nocardioides sp. CER19 TaxID=3038538 RepID=UPI002446855A|nr:TIM-barrel domain-containing protein [Nocardioides sp. CER19]MDH2414395.1 glycoside hydrolase family 31 protein [Nocardioides sp. CER19]
MHPPHLRPRRSAVAALAGTAAVVAATLVPTSAANDAAAAVPAKQHPAAVVSGNARFEVLSPTLVRTEYAGDAHFVDAGTFNAVGRGDFAPTRYTTSTEDGWLTIATSRLTLNYQVGSGPFTDRNLRISLRSGGQDVTAAPWPAPVRCDVGTLCEAENMRLQGPGIAKDHGGYTGSGFVAGFSGVGDSIGFQTTSAQAATYDLDLRYANSTGGDGQNTTRTLTVAVDGGSPRTISLPPTGSWDTWKVTTVPLSLPAGDHSVAITRTSGDSGNVNLDSLALVSPGAAYPSPTATGPLACDYGQVCQAETAALVGGAKVARDHNGYSADGFTAGLERTGAGVTLTVDGVPASGTYDLQLRYANAKAGSHPVQDRTMTVQPGSADPTTVTLAPTSSWDTWRTVAVPVTLPAGTSTIALGCPTDDSCNVNLDTASVAARHSALLAPHAALGGYRRGLDGVDGSALTAPGLLYQDGWSLLDDSASALFDPSTDKVTPKPQQSSYQDGYVFGYGQDYPQALRDLSVLTGPTALLPRWSYGTWWAEYYDRTAAQYQDLVKRFRSEDVPLDMLVVDTDFKAPNKWNGWEIDPTRIPDPEAFLDWVHQQGLHTSFNIHPSILASDPQFAAAQATAKGKLQRGGCGGGGSECYVFDFGDPDQLAAYLGLHDTMEKQGVDVWWLDWCCDGSSSTLPGVTPDAWINDQYARRADTTVGRGFAFSRAYGSLQAGGYGSPTPVPTGPWADKRTTLHFTGDTTSDWQTLAFEVGYTPGESVATGNASVSHDIGGHTGGLQEPGSQPGESKLPDDLYARWVQLGTFQPIDRLHSNHSARLPWQYGEAAEKSAKSFLNLRERLLPYTYTLAHEATATGVPIARPLYLAYPQAQEAYARADAEYLYGPDVLVAPVTTPGTSATTTVWFPPGSSWTDWFTGKTYEGGTTAQVTTDLSRMPVFLRSGGIVTTRTDDVSGDAQNPLTAATVTVAEGAASGSATLYEDDGTTRDLTQSATTEIDYARLGANHRVTVAPVEGRFGGQVENRAWTVEYRNADQPRAVSANGRPLPASAWSYDSATRTLAVRTPAQSVHQRLVVDYR